MKKTFILAILVLVGAVTSSLAQGYISMDNYNVQSPPKATYGPLGGGPLGIGIYGAQWTVGLYFGEGTFAASVPADPDLLSRSIPTSLHPSLLLATGPGSTAPIVLFGEFVSGVDFQANSVAGATSTFMVVAYNGASYESSTIRGHSAAFEMVCKPGTTTTFPFLVGDFMSAFQVNAVPEPSTMTLAGLGLALLLFARRRE